MTHLLNETRIPLSLAPRHRLYRQGARPGRPTHRSTVERHRTRGVRGVVLETFLIGGTRYTTEEALMRFFERINTPGATSDTVAPTDRARQVAAADARLAAAGI